MNVVYVHVWIYMYVTEFEVQISSSYKEVLLEYIWVGWVLWHTNPYRLFNAKYSLHTHTHIYDL